MKAFLTVFLILIYGTLTAFADDNLSADSCAVADDEVAVTKSVKSNTDCPSAEVSTTDNDTQLTEVTASEEAEKASEEAEKALETASETEAPKLALKTLDELMAQPKEGESQAGKYQFFKSVKVEKPYKFIDDQTFVGIPLFVAGLLIKSEKTFFRQNHSDPDPLRDKDRLVTHFKSGVDDYLQFAPIVAATGLKLAGVDGRSDWGRYLASSLMSYGIMAAFVNGIKYTVKEMRPDGSTANSFPSGHTATVFVGATILHKEYGLTHSPWYSIAGYAVATATGVMRVLNNRHWVSDVLAGAGIGIFSTELAYGLCDLIFKGKGLRRTDIIDEKSIINNPSFFSINMGVGLGNRNLVFDYTDYDFDEHDNPYTYDTRLPFRFKASTYVGVEGAFFFNKYIGVGGKLGISSTPVDGFGDLADQVYKSFEIVSNPQYWTSDNFMRPDETNPQKTPIDTKKSLITIESDHITEFTATAGIYLNFPLSRHFAIGTKVLVGRSIINDLDLDLNVSGNKLVRDDPSSKYTFRMADEFHKKWDLLNITGNNTMTYGTGVSFTYAYRSNFSWRFFVDYNYSHKTYRLTVDKYSYLKEMMSEMYSSNDPEYVAYRNFVESYASPIKSSMKKHMNIFTIGGAFCVSF
ncbi:MAG: phosphatase PAP2 family protein [Bacteroidaceae bacterium]|nr:phosphatase PAP2 family protein [Bacteroidaceae bacterium]